VAPKFTLANIKEAGYNTIGNCLPRKGGRRRSLRPFSLHSFLSCSKKRREKGRS
jgi:hypothetical protein